MPISKDLFLAILSMDAYNRGYNTGINFASNDSLGTSIGNATIVAARGQDPIVVDIANKLRWFPALKLAQKGKGILSEPRKFQLIYNMFVGENS